MAFFPALSKKDVIPLKPQDTENLSLSIDFATDGILISLILKIGRWESGMTSSIFASIVIFFTDSLNTLQ